VLHPLSEGADVLCVTSHVGFLHSAKHTPAPWLRETMQFDMA